MKIYAISLVKNEEDIIAQNLLHASKWCDKIYVLDNGSTDDTWKIVNEISSNKIIPYKSENVPYRDSLRQEVFEYFRGELVDGDWVCFKLDADEFYIDDPRIFLGELRNSVSLVFGANIEFQFTDENLKYRDAIFDFSQFDYFKIPTCEQRFIKYRSQLKWRENDSIPLHPGVPSTKLIKFAHYQFRNPLQIQKRLDARLDAVKSGHDAYWSQDLNKKWEDKIIDKNLLFKKSEIKDLDILIKQSGVKIHEGWLKIFVKRVLHFLKIWP